jgi:hypothetical protein
MTDPYAALATITRPALVGRCPVCGRFFTAERRSKVYDRAVCAVKASEARLGKRRPTYPGPRQSPVMRAGLGCGRGARPGRC